MLIIAGGVVLAYFFIQSLPVICDGLGELIDLVTPLLKWLFYAFVLWFYGMAVWFLYAMFTGVKLGH